MKGLRVHQEKHYLMWEDGTPFFYLGDTAWELFHRLDREEAAEYLETRTAQGFHVIQAAALAELDGIYMGNAYGHRPLVMKEDGICLPGNGENCFQGQRLVRRIGNMWTGSFIRLGNWDYLWGFCLVGVISGIRRGDAGLRFSGIQRVLMIMAPG